MADTTVPSNINLPRTGIPLVDSGFTLIAQLLARTSADLQEALNPPDGGGGTGGTGTGGVPTNNPVPTGITVTTNSDGSMDVTLTWDYEQGEIQADFLVLFWSQGPASLSSPTVSDKALLLAHSATSFTFNGWNPNSNYRFGIAAGRKDEAGTSIGIGTIQAPTAAPDWADVSASGNYTANVASTAAATVVANASNGATAYTGTANYRTAGAPSNDPTPASLTTGTDTDGSARYTLAWNYTQGARKADGFFFFVKEGATASFALTDPHFELGAANTGTFSTSITLKGYPSDRSLSFGVAAFRRTESAVEIGTIITSASAPDWQGITTGSPNYAGTIFGKEQHTWEVWSAGQFADDTTCKIERDGVSLLSFDAAVGGRSYTLLVYDLVAKAVVYGPTRHDVYAWRAARNNLERAAQAYTDRTKHLHILLGAHEPQRNRTTNFPFVQQVGAAASPFGKQQAVSGLTIGATYTVSLWSLLAARTSGGIRADIDGTTTITNSTKTAAESYWTMPTLTFVATATSHTLRFFCESSFAGTALWAEAWFCAGSAAGGNTNLLTNGDFATGDFTGWSNIGAPAGGESITVSTIDGQTLPNLLAALGGSRSLFAANSFQHRAAYILVGLPTSGDGNGLEVYAGTLPDDPAAMARLTFQTQDNAVVALSGQGWKPDTSPGVPTNNPTASSVSVSASPTGADIITIGWNYTQPALEGTNKLADGFIVDVKSGTSGTPASSPTASYKVDIASRSFTMQSPLNQSWSLAVSAYRKTANGIEKGTPITSASSPDWQGIGGSSTVTTTGIADANVTGAKIPNSAITNSHVASLSAAKLNTGQLTVNPSSAVSGILVENGGDIVMKGSVSTISFVNDSGVEKASITGNVGGSLTIQADGPFLTLDCPDVVATSGLSVAELRMIRTAGSVGSASGYMLVRDLVSGNVYKIQLYT